ncbi:MAG: PAS domain S-box protein [Candidatus Lokiarchaeota archaeon]|nr:PAS domain S-box protein [Candidatus Lokiarchaeota archaeon]
MKKQKTKKLESSEFNSETLNIFKIYDSVPISIAVYNSDDKSVRLNTKFTEVFGYSEAEIKTVDDWWNLCVPDENKRKTLKTIWNRSLMTSIKNNSEFEPMEMEIQGKSGSKKYIRYTPKIIKPYYVGFFLDITDLKEAMDKKLLVSERRTNSLLYAPKNIPQAIFDRNGIILEINDAAIRETKISADKLLGKNLFSLLKEYGIENIYKFEEVIQKKKAINIQIEFLKSKYDVEYYPLLNEYEEVEKVALYARNLSDMFLKERLQDSEIRFKSFMEHGPFKAYIKDKNGKYIYGNPAALEFIKSVSDKEFIGSEVGDFFNDETAEKMSSYEQKILQTKKSIEIDPHSRTDKTGKEIWMKEIKFPIPISKEELLIGGIVLDVTDEVILKQNLLLTQYSVENSGIGIVWTNEDAKFIYANNYACKMFGYSKEEFLQLHVWDITPHYTRDISKRLIQQMLESVVHTNETMAKRKDGSEFPIYVNVNYLNINNKSYMFGYFFDLSEKRENKKKLQLAQFSMDHSSIPILTINEKGDIIYVNEIAIQKLGYTMEEILKLKAWDLSADTDRSDFPKRIQKITQLKKDSGETIIKKAGGDTFPAFITVNYLKLPDEALYNVYIQDMTLQRKNELELNKLYNATEQSPISVVITNPDGNIEYINPKFCSLTGYKQEELIGKNPRVLKTGYTTPQEYSQLWRTIKNGEVWQGTFRNVKKNGEFFWENATICPIFGLDGRIQNFLGIKEDITEKITLQEQLQHSQKMEALGRLAGGIAHDFNNILTVIMGTAQLLQYDMKDEIMNEYLTEIVKASNKAAGLTKQLLAFGKKQVLKPQYLDLNRVLVDMEGMLRRILPENIHFTFVLHNQPITIKVDKVQLEQVILNIVINAKEAMVNGGNLTITTSVNSKHVGNQLKYCGTLSISDTGVGMDEHTKMRLFEPFFTTKEKGTGLGLATVYGIVSQSDGDIEVDSDLGEGSAFVVNFPLRLNPIEEEEEIIVKKSEWRGTETILLIEDEEAVRKVVYQILINEGYTVWMAENGESAILNYSHLVDKIDLIISDVIMPIMGGIEAVSRFQEIRPSVKIIFMSGYAGEENSMNEKEIFITKPINRIDLLKKIREALD